ncbi:MAG: hypothetical protein J5J06_18865 [Phycisphaerae bacterium]|nr:hypothetical protein [Phycisphaerae bacterium]
MKSQSQRTLLFGFVGSIAACGLVGVYCLLEGNFGALQARIMGTTASVAAAAILGMASAIPWERDRWHPVGPLGALSVSIALGLVLFAIWASDWIDNRRWFEDFLRVMGTACVAGVALPHVGLLSLARLRGSYEWVRRWTVIANAILSLQIIESIWEPPQGDLWPRAIGIVAIVVACGTVAVPILHRITGIQRREAVRTVELFVDLTCPRCTSTQHLPAGRSRCGSCGLRFLIEIEEETCENCGYPLYQLTSANCPECGTPIMAPNTTPASSFNA